MKHFYFLMRGRNVGTVPTILLPLKRHTPLHHHIITTVISSHEFHPLEPGLAHSREGAVRTGTRLHFYLNSSTTHYTTHHIVVLTEAQQVSHYVVYTQTIVPTMVSDAVFIVLSVDSTYFSYEYFIFTLGFFQPKIFFGIIWSNKYSVLHATLLQVEPICVCHDSLV